MQVNLVNVDDIRPYTNGLPTKPWSARHVCARSTISYEVNPATNAMDRNGPASALTVAAGGSKF